MKHNAAGVLGDDLVKRMRAVAETSNEDFRHLLQVAGLSPAAALRFQQWSGSSFANCDLSGFDFTGARLLGCDFAGARIAEARFDQAEIYRAGQYPKHRTDLRKARDWHDHVRGWRKAPRLVNDAHLRIGSVFQDAPFAPELVVVPPGKFVMGSAPNEPGRSGDEGPQHFVTIGRTFAVGRYAVTFAE